MSYRIGGAINQLKQAGFTVFRCSKSANWKVRDSGGDEHLLHRVKGPNGSVIHVGNTPLVQFLSVPVTFR